MNFKIKISWIVWESRIYIYCWIICVFFLQDYSYWWILISTLWEKSLIPLTYTQKSRRLIFNFEWVRWIKSCFVFWFNCSSTIRIVGAGYHDIRNEILSLICAELENSLFAKVQFRFLLNCSPTISKL